MRPSSSRLQVRLAIRYVTTGGGSALRPQSRNCRRLGLPDTRQARRGAEAAGGRAPHGRGGRARGGEGVDRLLPEQGDGQSSQVSLTLGARVSARSSRGLGRGAAGADSAASRIHPPLASLLRLLRGGRRRGGDVVRRCPLRGASGAPLSVSRHQLPVARTLDGHAARAGDCLRAGGGRLAPVPALDGLDRAEGPEREAGLEEVVWCN